jgi:hypothetical protein
LRFFRSEAGIGALPGPLEAARDLARVSGSIAACTGSSSATLPSSSLVTKKTCWQREQRTLLPVGLMRLGSNLNLVLHTSQVTIIGTSPEAIIQ